MKKVVCVVFSFYLKDRQTRSTIPAIAGNEFQPCETLPQIAGNEFVAPNSSARHCGSEFGVQDLSPADGQSLFGVGDAGRLAERGGDVADVQGADGGVFA